jgi:hypothetical protein
VTSRGEWVDPLVPDRGCVDFRELRLGEVRRIPLLRTRVNSVGWSQGVEGKEEIPTMEVIST